MCCHNPPNSDTDYRIFIVCTDVNACDCTRRCTDTVRESALKVGSGKKKIPRRAGESNCFSGETVRCSNQLSYIPCPHVFSSVLAARFNLKVHDGGFFLACEDLGRMFHHSFPACAFFFFFKVEIRLRTLISLFRPGSVHSAAAS